MTKSISISVRHCAILAGLALPFAVGGCAPIIANRGNLLDEERIAQVKVASSSKNDVFEALGSPTIVSTFDDNTWYYVGQRTEQVSFLDPVIAERKVIAVEFDDTDHVKAVDRVPLEQAVDVEPMEQTTPAVGREITFMEQLLGSVGRGNSSKKKKKSGDEGS
jgi:outer membrane protein assembly factor BamE (lipoprotein component of BamABCDE complex)